MKHAMSLVHYPALRAASLSAFILCAVAPPARAQTPAPADNQAQPNAPSTTQSPVPGGSAQGSPAAEPSPGQRGFTTSLFAPSHTALLGDIYGLRTLLAQHGVSLGLLEASEVKGNPTGGYRGAVAYNGLTTISLGIDTAKAFGLAGGTFNVSALQIHGRNYSLENLGSLQTASGIEAARSTRLWELWYQQVLVPDRLDVKLGQQSLDQEFMVSSYGGLFVNAAMGWAVLPTLDQYAGGPAYPLSSLGVRLRGQPVDSVTVLAGVFDDNPPGGPFLNDGQTRGAERAGAAFNTGTGALFIAEVQYALNQPASGSGAAGGLPGTYKLGGWYDTGAFLDQRFDASGVSLASAAINATGRTRRHNWSLYAVADQTVWRPSADSPQSVGVFLRLTGAPGDRNLVDFSANGGVTLKALLPGRDNDTVGFGAGFAKIGPNAVRVTQDAAGLSGGYPVRSGETFVELTYQAQVAPWWVVQPDFQYVWTPGGGVPNPLDRTRRVGNAAVLGLRTNVTF